ncbi:MAG: hypothetical protein IIB83_07465, partial [Bacteroidetes bacterium]|nr:hypothetical protein [Bacteroidota bacterium]
FKHIVALSTKTIPFLSERAHIQREMIEELLGVTQLSVKSEKLREKIKDTKTEIDSEELRIRLIKQQNEKTEQTIIEIKRKAMLWEKGHLSNAETLVSKIIKLQEVEIDTEINDHKIYIKYTILKLFIIHN